MPFEELGEKSRPRISHECLSLLLFCRRREHYYSKEQVRGNVHDDDD